jgi:hypothetical protein
MKTKQKEPLNSPRPKLDRAFRKSLWLQIYLPFILILLLLAAVVASLWIGGAGTFSGWADAALVILMIPALLMGLVLFVFLAGLCYGLLYIYGLIPRPAKRAQEITARISAGTRRFADLAIRPILIPRAVKTTIVETIHYLTAIFSREG